MTKAEIEGLLLGFGLHAADAALCALLASCLHRIHCNVSKTMLIVVGTYSEQLGHVTGKGDGLYVLELDDETLTLKSNVEHDTAANTFFFGRPQLGPASGRLGLANPTYLIAHEPKGAKDATSVVIYVVDEREDHPGTLRALTLNKRTGELSPLGDEHDIVAADDRPHEGGACCHVMVTPDEKYVLAANYLCGSLVVVGRREDGSLDSDDVRYYRLDGTPVKVDDDVTITFPGPNANRQDRAHAHMVLYSKGSESDSILVPDLGSDCVWSIPYVGPRISGGPLGTPIATGYDPVLAGGGPRHAVLHPNPTIRKIYVAYELTSLVASFDIDEKTGAIVSSSMPSYSRPNVCNVLAGTKSHSFYSDASAASTSEEDRRAYEQFLRYDSKKESVPTCADKDTSVAAIRITPDASHLLVSSRIVNGEGTISALPLLENGDLNPQFSAKIRGVLGRTPRDFVVMDGPTTAPTIIAASQDTDEIVVLREGEEAVILTKDAPTPVCLCVVPT